MREPRVGEREAYFTAIGRALNNFSRIEHELEALFCALGDINPTVGHAGDH